MQVFAGIIIIFFFILGVVSLIKWLVLKITTPYDVDTRLYAVMLSGSSADIELQMALETLHWDIGLKNVRTYAIDCGIDNECKETCRKMCKGSRFRLITVEEFSELLKVYYKK